MTRAARSFPWGMSGESEGDESDAIVSRGSSDTDYVPTEANYVSDMFTHDPRERRAGEVATNPTSNWWLRQVSKSLHTGAKEYVKSGDQDSFTAMLKQNAKSVLLPPEGGESQPGPWQSLYSLAISYGRTEIAQLIKQEATEMFIKALHEALDAGTSGAQLEDILRTYLEAGADLGCAAEAGGGYLPLHFICAYSPPAASLPNAVGLGKVAALMAQLAPATLLRSDPSGNLPLETAAANPALGPVLVPMLCMQLGMALLTKPALASSPQVLRAAEIAHESHPGDNPRQLLEFVRSAAAATNDALPQQALFYESWVQQFQRVIFLEQVLGTMRTNSREASAAESQLRVAELEQLLDSRQREHEQRMAEVMRALDRAQRDAEEAMRRLEQAQQRAPSAATVEVASAAVSSSAASIAVAATPINTKTAASGRESGRGSPGAEEGCGEGQGVAADEDEVSGPERVIRRIRRQRGLDIDLSTLPAAIAESTRSMQRSIGAAVERLASDLYTSKGHFMLELLQNADDNRYAPGVEAMISFVLGEAGAGGATFFYAVNNELGMSEKDVEALCDVNRSMKQAQDALIGRKGVGWKSVFAVSDVPTVLSGDFRFCFDTCRLGRLGYVTPELLSGEEIEALPAGVLEAHEGPPRATVTLLPLRGAETPALVRSCAQELFAFPAWLLFLRRLQRVQWEDRVAQPPVRVLVERSGDAIVTRRWKGEAEEGPREAVRYLVHRKRATLPVQLQEPGKSPKEEVVVAFPPAEASEAEDAASGHAPQPDGGANPTLPPVFCFLPVRPVGFRFLLHAPWVLTSNREDWHLQDPRNLWLRGLCSAALAEAITAYGPQLGVHGLGMLDGRHVLDAFWRRLLEEASSALGDAPIVPVEGQEGLLVKPSEALVPPEALARSSASMRLLRSVPAEAWRAATGKWLARLSGARGGAAEDSRRLIALKAEVLSSSHLEVTLNSPAAEEAVRQPDALGLLCELLSQWLGARGEADGQQGADNLESGVAMAASVQKIRIFPLRRQLRPEASAPAEMACLADGHIFIPAAADHWCPGVGADTCSKLLAHRGVRVLDLNAWRALSGNSKALLQQMGLRPANLAEVAAVVVRIHTLYMSQAALVGSIADAFVCRSKSAAPGEAPVQPLEAQIEKLFEAQEAARMGRANRTLPQEEELSVVWAGLDAVRLAHKDAFANILASIEGPRDPARQDQKRVVPSHDSAEPTLLQPAMLGGVCVRRTQATMLDPAALKNVLWMPCRFRDGGVLFRHPPDMILPSFLGTAVAEVRRASCPGDDSDDAEFESKLQVWLPAPSLEWEAFLVELGCELPPPSSINKEALGRTIVSPELWRALAESVNLRKYACKVFRENGSWLPDLEVPGFSSGSQAPRRVRCYFRRSVFQPLVGDGVLPLLDVDTCNPLLELLHIPVYADATSLGHLMRAWAGLTPPPSHAPKALCAALLQEGLAGRLPNSVLNQLSNCIFIPGQGVVRRWDAVWTAESKFATKVLHLTKTPVLCDVYGSDLMAWFCDFLKVPREFTAYSIIATLKVISRLQVAGTANQKITLPFVKRIYEVVYQFMIAGRQMGEPSRKRGRFHEEEVGTENTMSPEAIMHEFTLHRLIVLPQARGLPWKFVRTTDAFWTVDDDLADLPCSIWSLSNFYADDEGELHAFFTAGLGVKEKLTREQLLQQLNILDDGITQGRTQVATRAPPFAGQFRPGRGLEVESDSDGAEGEVTEEGFSMGDLLGDDASLLGAAFALGSAAESLGDERIGRMPTGAVHRAGSAGGASTESAALAAQISRCVRMSQGANLGDVFYQTASEPRAVRASGREEVSVQRVYCNAALDQRHCLYACGPPSTLASANELRQLGLRRGSRSAGQRTASLQASPELAERVAAFGRFVLKPLAAVLEMSVTSLAVAVGPAVPRGRNVRGVLLFGLDFFDSSRGRASSALRDGDVASSAGGGITREERCQWFCEACRLLAENSGSTGFTSPELMAALLARFLPRFWQAEQRLAGAAAMRGR